MVLTAADGFLAFACVFTLKSDTIALSYHGIIKSAKLSARILAVVIVFLLWYAVDNIVLMTAMWMFRDSYLSFIMQKSVYLFAGFTAKIVMLLRVTLFSVLLEKKQQETPLGKTENQQLAAAVFHCAVQRFYHGADGESGH